MASRLYCSSWLATPCQVIAQPQTHFKCSCCFHHLCFRLFRSTGKDETGGLCRSSERAANYHVKGSASRSYTGSWQRRSTSMVCITGNHSRSYERLCAIALCYRCRRDSFVTPVNKYGPVRLIVGIFDQEAWLMGCITMLRISGFG